MADPIIRVKRSTVSGKTPTTEQLGLGEIAINHYDGKVFIRQDTGGVGVGTTVIEVGSSQSTDLSISDGFVPVDEKVISNNLTLNNGQENVTFAEDLVIGDGVTFTVSAGSTVRVNALDNLSPDILNVPKGTLEERPSTPVIGSLRYNNFLNLMEFYNGTTWLQLVVASLGDISVRGVFGGGSTTNIIDYITIESTGDATDFGDLTVARFDLAACSSSTRGVFGGGATPALVNTIDYITIATTGDATDFGDLTSARYRLAACSSSTRGVFGGGATPINTNTIDYITIATTGDATDFGDLTVARQSLSACSSSTRGVFGGGAAPGNSKITDYITIASTGDATDFGDLTSARSSLSACSSSTRGVFGGGSPTVNTIDYITIATTGNANDFGDLTVARDSLSACSSSTRGVFGGGYIAPALSNIIDYITIATTGDATDFGDLTSTRSDLSACSSAHGGLS